MLRGPTKDPNDERYYGLDWSDELGTDQVASSTWAVSPGGGANMLIYEQSFTPTQTVVWVSGGVAGTHYRLTNTITTQDGQIRTESLLVYCDEK